MYKISIIVPVYNVEQFLDVALNSIKKQTIGFENLQVIFVNDCSDDFSGVIIDDFAKKYDNIISIHLETNSGYAGTPRNVGINYATSDYIMFLDPDDYYVNNACEVLYDEIIETGSDIVFGTYKLTKDSNHKIQKNTFKNIVRVEKIDEELNLLKLYPSIWTKIYNRKFIVDNNIRFLDGVPAQDLVFVVNSFLKANGIVYLPNNIITCYNFTRQKNNCSVSHNISKKYLLGLIDANTELYNIIKNEDNFVELFLILRGHISHIFNQLMKSNLDKKDKIDILNYFGPLCSNLNDIENYSLNSIYWEPVFTKVSDKKFEEALDILDLLIPILYKVNKLNNSIKSKNKQIKRLKSTKYWIKYKLKKFLHKLF
ncbi:glycosyltransferase family 2 protein [Methanobrevibacter sp.]|uniref:glycosyltransferase family 2 protein n=1 Tax=Methanobrevibacter sp. TaxID=66852 RepID=UPI0026336D03|nr:glycosyltransferase family 2 protein [uncultured Methanobrevibacter sp.]